MDNHNGNDIATSPLQVQEIPDQISHTLTHIVRQLDILTQTMSILEVLYDLLSSHLMKFRFYQQLVAPHHYRGSNV